MQRDLQGAFSGEATVHIEPMTLDEPITVDSELRMLDQYVEPAARELARVKPHLVVFGCTSASTLRGHNADARLRSRLTGITGAPVVGVFEAMVDRLRGLGARRIAVLTPYPIRLNQPLAAGLRAAGFTTVSVVGLGIELNAEVARIAPERIIDAATSVIAAAQVPDALAIACTNFRALEAKSRIEIAAGIPVVTSNSAVVEAARERLG
jgi:maleate isomerase